MAVKCRKGTPMPGQDRQPVYKFGAWEIDLARREMRLNGIQAEVGSRAFEILETLVVRFN
jgi:DNA-binding response OmpR family regulator